MRPSLLFLLVFLPLTAPAQSPTIVCFGDSITAGYNLEFAQSWPSQLQLLLPSAKIINRGTAGDTTKDALARLPQILAIHPSIVVVEFGGNDGLRGISTALTRANLDKVLTTLQAAHIRVLLVGITLPPNYGPDYVRDFSAIFPALARQHHTALMPMIYDNIYTLSGTIQPDGIHPTAKGSQLIAQHSLPFLKPLLSH